MKILHKSQIQEADRQTISKEPISSINLMERAAEACVQWIVKHCGPDQAFLVLCGTGNNGGDGLAIYRILRQKDYACSLYEFALGKNQSVDHALNRKKIPEKEIKKLNLKALSSFPKNHIIIDALLGTGLNRPVTGALKEIIQKLNSLPNRVISIDLPSGLFSEFNTHNPQEGIIQADHTLCFQLPKLAFLLPECGMKTGSFHLLDIRLLPGYIDKTKTPHHYLTSKKAHSLYRKVKKFDHKGNNGHLLLVAGSQGKMGAATLSARAALRTGLGKLSVLTPQCGIEILQIAIPESMVEINTGINSLSGFYGLEYKTISIGPGIGTTSETKAFLHSLISENEAQLVIDADALNLLSTEKKWIDLLPKNSILTPHPKEFERLVGTWKNDEEKLLLLTEFSQKHQLICVLKGAHTAIALPDGTVWFNSSGNPGMATAGSGDVLTGIIGGLLAKGYPPIDAALLGVYAHGRAADHQSNTFSPPFMLASDIIDGLNQVWMEMEKTINK